MKLAEHNYFSSTMGFTHGKKPVRVVVYSYESYNAVYDVVKFPWRDTLMFRVNEGAWSFKSEPIHRAIVRHFGLDCLE